MRLLKKVKRRYSKTQKRPFLTWWAQQRRRRRDSDDEFDLLPTMPPYWDDTLIWNDNSYWNEMDIIHWNDDLVWGDDNSFNG